MSQEIEQRVTKINQDVKYRDSLDTLATGTQMAPPSLPKLVPIDRKHPKMRK